MAFVLRGWSGTWEADSQLSSLPWMSLVTQAVQPHIYFISESSEEGRRNKAFIIKRFPYKKEWWYFTCSSLVFGHCAGVEIGKPLVVICQLRDSRSLRNQDHWLKYRKIMSGKILGSLWQWLASCFPISASSSSSADRLVAKDHQCLHTDKRRHSSPLG